MEPENEDLSFVGLILPSKLKLDAFVGKTRCYCTIADWNHMMSLTKLIISAFGTTLYPASICYTLAKLYVCTERISLLGTMYQVEY
tara:strand:+ start:3308 stop:3565 length:258 start_codon:yes stop_codon:yes gene_type:complete